jgi:hypothetical protein
MEDKSKLPDFGLARWLSNLFYKSDGGMFIFQLCPKF